MFTTVTPAVRFINYYTFGMQMPGRNHNSSDYKYGFNGKMKDDELKTNGNSYDFGARIYDPRLGRFLSIDSKNKLAPNWTPYRISFDNPIQYKDKDGNYETDVHYWTTLLVASLLKIPDAKQIAHFAELPDHWINENGNPTATTMTWAFRSAQKSLHALTGGDAAKERAMSRQMVKEAKTLQDLGFAIHRLGDSYSHTNDETGKMFETGFGHAFTDEGGTAPDKIYNRPNLYLEYVNDLANTLSKKYSNKEANIDLFAFTYLAKGITSSENNADILKTEVSIRSGGTSININPDNSYSVEQFLTERQAQYKDFTFRIVDSQVNTTTGMEKRTTVYIDKVEPNVKTGGDKDNGGPSFK